MRALLAMLVLVDLTVTTSPVTAALCEKNSGVISLASTSSASAFPTSALGTPPFHREF